jgi:hypothetical protein
MMERKIRRKEVDKSNGYNIFRRVVLTMFSDATMANLQDDSPDLHIADAPRARTIGIRASARIFDPSRKVTAAKIPAFSNSRPLSAIDFGHGRRQSYCCCCCFIC